ncbi:glycosyltransferase family 4 protein [Actinomycetes bacterium KLBMP 9797]
MGGLRTLAVRTVHFVLPGGVADPGAPSGGNRYDRLVSAGLTAAGWDVHHHAVHGGWPRPRDTERAALAEALSGVPDGSLALLDGLVACGVPEVVAPHAGRLRLAVLVHLPLADETGLPPAEAAALDALERETLRVAAAVVATSDHTARRLARQHGLPADRTHVAVPGVDPAPLAPGSDSGGRLLCVAAVTPRKAQDVLLDALATVAGPWTCELVGALDRAPEYVAGLRRKVVAPRVRFTGPLAGEALDAAYAGADLLVLPSHAETYGMVLTEALARGVPVLASDVGGVPEAVGRAPDGAVPGMLVPPGDPATLAAALRRWLGEPELRERLRAAARARREALPSWDATVTSIEIVLKGMR